MGITQSAVSQHLNNLEDKQDQACEFLISIRHSLWLLSIGLEGATFFNFVQYQLDQLKL